MTTYRRSGFKWSINELLSLQREYELLEWTVQEIAAKHERSVEAILFRLESEGFINSWNSARGYNQIDYQNAIEGGDSLESNCEDNEVVDEDEDEDSEAVYEEDVSSICDAPPNEDIQTLTDRVSSLESVIFDVKVMIAQMMESMKKNLSGKTENVSEI